MASAHEAANQSDNRGRFNSYDLSTRNFPKALGLMTAVSLQFVVGYAVLVSAVVMWLNRRSPSAASTAGVLLALCIVIAVVHLLPRGLAMPARQAIQIWLVFVLLPTAAVWGLSRADFLVNRPWVLLLVGPIAFMMALIVFGTAFNAVFAARRLR